MHVSVIGSGYVGATLTGCLAALGHEVTAIDIDESVVASIEAGEPPMAEPRLGELYDENADRISATTDYAAVRETDCSFITVQTPAREDGSIDPSVVLAAAESLGEALAQKETFHTVAVKSTAIPGMVEEEVVPRIEQAAGPEGETFATAVNPEFQAQGSAVDDFMHPDKVVIGTDDDRALDALRAVYAPLPDEPPVVETGRREAAMMKYANNVFLAAKVSLINELGNICKEYGVDSYEVAEAMGLDDRIGAQFLRSGVGWGGSCFPKDTDALRAAARDRDYEPELLDAVVGVNETQPRRLLELLDRHVDVAGERVAVLGLAFKPDTDDIRGSRAKPVIAGLQERGAEVAAYDPSDASETMARAYPDVEYTDSASDALSGAVGALVVTDWPAFGALDGEFDAMARQVVVDGRRIIEAREGMTYEGLTW
ncbi:UDP-glucose 6-dehydrogenase AglM [Halosegnis rubeus]|uniref:UDP-glucose 6-dehydrogenase n=1 Tax=Halosegnis rubeus TaxID=2212850 RepID=A0A5N5UH58_9EURY|nr:UDP-glucose 6-dehydrogenase AglM [Halosegnis rubeus]KAB7518018.1 nucleotide sugar dehydrogenase [Halosegnis rubeus]